MSGLVIELQREALDGKSSVAALLRKAVVVASKLGVSELEQWARNELDGYHGGIPEYRRIVGSPRVFNPYHGYQELHFHSPDQAKRFTKMNLNTSVDELESLIAGATTGGVIVGYQPEVEKLMKDAMELPLTPSLYFATSALQGILGRVRTIVLEWSLRLEKQGVLGEGMTFTATEKERASVVNVHTLIQGIKNSQIQVDSPSAQQTQSSDQVVRHLVEIIAGLQRIIETGPTDSDEISELRAELSTLKAQQSSPKPKIGVITESLKSVRAILEGAAGSVLASSAPAILAAINRALGSG